MSYKVPFIKPSFPSAEEMVQDYKAIVASNWFTNFGPFEQKFSKKIADYIGNNYYAVTFSSATAGLIASMLALVGKGNDTQYVLMPSFTFAAGADSIAWCGYKPLFIDIEDGGLHMSIDEARKALDKEGSKIAGILFCNAFGVGTNNIADWEKLAKKFSKPLIIDSAAGFGSKYSNHNKVGSAGDCEVFSFHATKSFAIGEGGAVVTKNKKLAANLRAIENFGFDQQKNATQLGFNGKLQEINAAIGLRQLRSFGDLLIRRRKIFENYKTGLDQSRYALQDNAENASLCFVTVIIKDADKRNELLEDLQSAGVDAKTYYSPSIHEHHYFNAARKLGSLPVTERIGASVLSLPAHDGITEDNIRLIVDILNRQ